MIRIKQNNKLRQQLQSSKLKINSIGLIRNHYCQWAWLDDHHYTAKFWPKEKFIRRLKKHLAIDCQKELARINKKEKNTRQQTNMTIASLNLTNEEKRLVKLAAKYVHFRTDRLDKLFYSGLLVSNLLKEIAKRLGIKLNQLFYLSPEDIQAGLKKKKNFRRLISSRQKNYAIILKNRKLKVYSGQAALKYQEKNQNKSSKIIIKGNAAYRGSVTGLVKIIRKKSEFKKLGKGEILVTTMTTPDYVPLMKKCAGIITDEGGITCHAAIVSRELKKPCLIGTGNATQILKDGNQVILNANHGIINIIK